jgi:hypothetical protein
MPQRHAQRVVDRKSKTERVSDYPGNQADELLHDMWDVLG